jgi:hypothetical protein
MFFSIKAASLLLLSRAINASKPNLTNGVFSLIPVNIEALSRIFTLELSGQAFNTYFVHKHD